jgi:hypothetical protein
MGFSLRTAATFQGSREAVEVGWNMDGLHGYLRCPGKQQTRWDNRHPHNETRQPLRGRQDQGALAELVQCHTSTSTAYMSNVGQEIHQIQSHKPTGHGDGISARHRKSSRGRRRCTADKAESHRLRAPGHGTGEVWSRRGAVSNAKRQRIPHRGAKTRSSAGSAR